MKIGHLYVYSVTKVYDSLSPIIDLCGEKHAYSPQKCGEYLADSPQIINFAT